jgi:hypothetical protein
MSVGLFYSRQGVLVTMSEFLISAMRAMKLPKGEAAFTRKVNPHPAVAWSCAALAYQGEHDPKALLGVPKVFVEQ